MLHGPGAAARNHLVALSTFSALAAGNEVPELSDSYGLRTFAVRRRRWQWLQPQGVTEVCVSVCACVTASG